MELAGNHSAEARTGPTGFGSTHWTVVLEAAQQSSPAGQAALGTLCRTYWKPIYAFVRRSGHSPEDAEDLTQDFFARLVEKNWLASITREGGKFRSVLLTAVKHSLAHAHERDRALKRGGGTAFVSLDHESASWRDALETADHLTPERVFEQRWAMTMLENAMARLRQEYVRMEKADLFDALKIFLSGSARPVPHAEIAVRQDISVTAVGVAIHRLRRRYGEILREQVARTVSNPMEVDDELRHLVAVLGS